MIIESGIISASDTDLMSTGRLNAIPYNGTLTMQFESDLGDAANHWDLTIQKPNGDVPIDTQQLPANESGTAGVLNSRTMLELTFPATQGGHFVVSCVETGTAVLAYRFILRP